ncbi:hypothetical protein ACJJTC_019690 [Scirpophaga incertulas]
MPLTAAERQRRYKAKLKQNPEKYEESKRKNYHVKKRLVITKKLNLSVTLSSSIKHNPAAIWAHLDPVMKDILTLYPDVTTVHFCSDGPFSQYRQKQNFYLSSTLTFNYGFKAMTWSFFEAGHGKGPADGIGGYLKRSADDMVARGPDISNADNFYECLKDVNYRDIVEILSKPTQIIKRGQIYYNFNRVIDINEK